MKDLSKLNSSLLLVIGITLFVTSACAQERSLRTTLASTVSILKQHTAARTARLKVVSVAESKENALKASDRIAGYPIEGKLVSLDTKQSQQLVRLLLDNNKYANIRIRCKNQRFNGVRFNKGQQVIEMAIGTSCNQVLMVFRNSKGIKWWGGVMGNASAKKVLQLLEN